MEVVGQAKIVRPHVRMSCRKPKVIARKIR